VVEAAGTLLAARTGKASAPAARERIDATADGTWASLAAHSSETGFQMQRPSPAASSNAGAARRWVQHLEGDGQFDWKRSSGAAAETARVGPRRSASKGPPSRTWLLRSQGRDRLICSRHASSASASLPRGSPRRQTMSCRHLRRWIMGVTPQATQRALTCVSPSA